MSAVIERQHQLATKFILNHDIMNCTAEGVVGNQLYSGRALGLSEPWDIIQLHPDLKPLWADITAHYQRIGLSHSENVIWDIHLRELGAQVGHLATDTGNAFFDAAVGFVELPDLAGRLALRRQQFGDFPGGLAAHFLDIAGA